MSSDLTRLSVEGFGFLRDLRYRIVDLHQVLVRIESLHPLNYPHLHPVCLSRSELGQA